jgi:integrase
VHVLAETGARASQVSALDCAHLVGAALLMPASKKGKAGARKNRHCEPVAISDELAAKLRAMADGRDGSEPLLLNALGVRWQSINDSEFRRPFAAAVAATGLDPRRFTSYCLRHSHIVAQIKSGVAMLQVANWHDTSEAIIRRHYGKHINRTHDALAQARAALPTRVTNVIPFAA